MYTSINEKYHVDANLGASDSVISGNDPSSKMLAIKVKNRNEPKTGNSKEFRHK